MEAIRMTAPDLGTVAPNAIMGQSGTPQQSPMAQHRQHPAPQQQHTPSRTGHSQSPTQGNTTPRGSVQQPQLPNLVIQQHNPSRSVKRPRPVKSCTECRKRKLRCDRLCPCSQCQKSSRVCKYAADPESSNLSDSDDGGIESGRPAKRSCTTGPSPATSGSVANSGAPAAATVLSSVEAAHVPVRQGETATTVMVEELLARLNRMEKQLQARGLSGYGPETERLVPGPSHTLRGTKIKGDGMRSRFFGQNSARVMLNLFDDAKEFLANENGVNGMTDIMSSFKKLHQVLQDEYRKSLMPITVFVDSMMPVQKRMADILPKKPVCDRLVATYLESAEAVCRTLHITTFFEQYNLFWEGKMHDDFFLPMLLGVLAVASRFQTSTKGIGHERAEGVHIPTTAALIRTWLDGLKGKQKVQLTTLQIEILLVIVHKVIAKRYQDVWIQLGSVVRLAMSMGLHRDPSESGDRVSVFIGEIRRRLWYCVVDLDVQLALDCNQPASVQPGDYSCQPPRNLDDADLWPGMRELPPGKPIDHCTDAQGQVFTAALLPTRLRVTQLVNRVGNVDQMDEVMEVGQKLLGFLDDANVIFPRHTATNTAQKHRQYRLWVMLDMQVRRPLMALFRPYALAAPTAPSQVSRAYLRSCVVMLSYPDELDPGDSVREYLVDSYHQIFRYDLIQAALSVLYYIRCMTRQGQDPLAPIQHPFRMSPNVGADGFAERPGGIQIYSPSRLLGLVEDSLEVYIRTIHRGDTKAIVLMATVIELVKATNTRAEDVAQSLRAVLDRCLHAANVNLDKLTKQNAATSTGPTGTPVPSSATIGTYQGDGYTPSRSGSFMFTGDNNAAAAMPAFDFGGWYLWEGWD